MSTLSIVPTLQWPNCGIKDYSLWLANALRPIFPTRVVGSENPLDWRLMAESIPTEIVHLQYEYQFATPARVALFFKQCKEMGKGTVLTMHTVSPHLSRENELLTKYADIVVATNPRARHALAGFSTVVQIPLMSPDVEIDRRPEIVSARRHQMGIEPDVKVVATFGMLYPHKGVLDLINAVPDLPGDIHVLVLSTQPGNAPSLYMKQCLNIAENVLGLTREQISFCMQYLSLESIVKSLSVADLVVLPYQNYGSYASSAALKVCLCGCKNILLRRSSEVFSDVLDRDDLNWWDPDKTFLSQSIVQSLEYTNDATPLFDSCSAAKVAHLHAHWYRRLL